MPDRKCAFLLLPCLMLTTGCLREAADPWSLTPSSYNCWSNQRGCVNTSPPSIYCLPEEGDLLSVVDLVSIALKNSPETQKSWEDSLIAAAQYGTSLSANFPDISANAAYKTVRETTFFGGNQLLVDQFKQYGPWLSLSMLIFDWGATLYQNKEARELLLSTNFQHNRSIQRVIDTVTRDYYHYVASLEQLVASEANLHDAEVALRATEVKKESGIADKSDVLSAMTQVSKRQVRTLDFVEESVTTLARLKADMGIPADLDLNLVKEFPPPVPEALFPMEEYICEAYQLRPDLKALYRRLSSKRAGLESALREQWGGIDMQGAWGRPYFNDGLTQENDYSLEFSYQIPIFKGFAYQNQIREAQAEVLKAKSEIRELKIQINRQIVTAYQQIEISGDRLKASKMYVETAEGSYQSTLSKYKAGTTDFTTLVNSMTELADARNVYVSAKRDWFDALLSLAYSIGTLGQPTEVRCARL